MSTSRQDAWTQDEDLLLAEVVLRYIRDGGTQLQAFEEVGKRLSRTAAACGFRWNSIVRKQYKSGIELAKKQRKEQKNNALSLVVKNNKSIEKKDVISAVFLTAEQKEDLSFETVINYIKDLYDKASKYTCEEENTTKYAEKIKELEKKTFYLAAENEKLAKELKAVEEDYRALIEIMERARKMVVLQEEDHQQKVKFQMDKNGNLERIEK
ncbi:RsfA family transcriptional regulator [Bacillus methanolicus]|uniref:Putative spore coat protein regulator protein YlbO n=1 Tax=Bacillus methanolicus (strain MGA3 / ATCC 53907) TaxID=796606 RepID=I3DZ00_BACMM|nr:RsfA family transcriptional regulator [Bacillus methanolicus]AIE59545.1 putative spore coat protein regulator protein YlbO [Bacillus methanolicus MGA3]EIJ79471.1 putative spore coat protein regulator protein YlbO [Bacillus methanolicus MGA3]UQD51604.1 RsfA family transcriptional regulator [Bacillus methanolicus]